MCHPILFLNVCFCSLSHAVLGGMSSTFMSLFCGFMIKPSDFPDFWIFMYWLNPVHYVLEGLITTQFNRDHTLISITGSTDIVTAQTFVGDFYNDWHYSARGYDLLAFGLFIVVLRYSTHTRACFYWVLILHPVFPYLLGM